MKGQIGLVLEGGAMRGLYTAGILDVLMENGIHFDGMACVSAGACFGCNYKSGQIGRTIRYNKKLSKEWRYCSIRSLLLTGDLYGAEFCYEKVPLEIDPFDTEAFIKDPAKFWVVCTDVDTGRPVYHECTTGTGEDLQWIRASASMPLASRPVTIAGKRYLDGGVSDSIPLRFMEKSGYERNVVILTQPADYVKQPASPVMASMMKEMPYIRMAMAKRHELYNASRRHVAAQEAAGTVFAFYPEKPLPVGHIEHDPEKMQQAYDIGRNDAERRLDELKAFMEKEL